MDVLDEAVTHDAVVRKANSVHKSQTPMAIYGIYLKYVGDLVEQFWTAVSRIKALLAKTLHNTTHNAGIICNIIVILTSSF